MIVTIATDLPVPAADARRLAARPPVLAHVLWPWVQLTPLAPLPDAIQEGDELTVRLRFLGLIPAWRHTLRVERLEPELLESRESGGPVGAWNHRLTFTPTSERSCRYTDSVEIRAGLMTPLVVLFAQFIFRHRQARWRRLAALLA